MKYFGTDGIRDHVDGPLLKPALVRRLGLAAAKFFQSDTTTPRATVIIGHDTRASAGGILNDLSAGLQAGGIEVLSGGVIPTPAVACAVPKLQAVAGIAITASHNPYHDNGIKFFNAAGTKLTDAEEERLEQLLENCSDPGPRGGTPTAVDAESIYLETLKSVLPEGALRGWRIALDCAHGATYRTTPALLSCLGAELITTSCQPNGVNINAGCGSEHPQALQEVVRSQGAALGIAHDGDGDRLVLVDEQGDLVDGDELLAMIALNMLKKGNLAGKTLVATVMSNLGLDAAIRAAGGEVVRAGVGDRQVLQAMAEHGYCFGGEASGHLILKDWLPTGDGLLAALAALGILLESDQPLSQARKVVRLYPQRKKNLKVRTKLDLTQIAEYLRSYAGIERRLGADGRLLVRYSGTEPKIRLLVEAAQDAQAQAVLLELEQLIRTHLEVVDS